MSVFKVHARSTACTPVVYHELYVVAETVMQAVRLVSEKYTYEIEDVQLLHGDVLIQPHSFARGE